MVENSPNLELFAILHVYSDDTVLVAEFPEEMQKTIDNFYFCCKKKISMVIWLIIN